MVGTSGKIGVFDVVLRPNRLRRLRAKLGACASLASTSLETSVKPEGIGSVLRLATSGDVIAIVYLSVLPLEKLFPNDILRNGVLG